jgi:1-acyl-sn-glycerol-3-phosphate acyltransferase
LSLLTTDLHMATTNPSSALSKTVTSGFSPLVTSVIYPFGQMFLPNYFWQIKILGQENIPRTGATILAPTHRSYWDSMLIPYIAGPYVTGRGVRFMTSANQMLGLKGWFVRRLGGFPVDTVNPSVGSFRHAIELINQGELIAIYPEGGVFRDGTLHTLKKGLSRIALQAQSTNPDQDIKIVPISFRYSQEFAKWRDSVSIVINPPLSVADYAQKSVKAGSEALHQALTFAMQAAIDRNNLQTWN